MRHRPVLALLPVAFLAAGCGSSKLAPVSGRVTCDGKPLESAAIILSPFPEAESDLEAPRAANGEITNGRFESLSTFKHGDGAFVGKHRVLITMETPGTCRCLPTREIVLEVKPGGNNFDIELRDYSVKQGK